MLPLTALCQGMLVGDALRQDQHKIANKILPREHLLRGGNFTNWQGRGKKQPDLAGFDIMDQVLKHQLAPCGGVGAGNGRQLGVAPVTLDGEYHARRHYPILGKHPVKSKASKH